MGRFFLVIYSHVLIDFLRCNHRVFVTDGNDDLKKKRINKRMVKMYFICDNGGKVIMELSYFLHK